MQPPSMDELPLSEEENEYGESNSWDWEEEFPNPEIEDLLDPYANDNETFVCEAKPGSVICEYCLNSCLRGYQFSEN